MSIQCVRMRAGTLTAVLVLLCMFSVAQPTITGFSPAKGVTGMLGSTTVTINGTGFSTTPANNIVFFGAVYATAVTATATQLTVTAPAGASCAYLGVLNKETGLIAQAYNQNPFIASYYNEGSMLFSASENYTWTSGTTLVRTFRLTDFDGDGKPDIVLLSKVATTTSIVVLRNTSTPGSISFDTGSPFVAESFTISVYALGVGDFNGDGKPDLLVSTSPGTVSTLRIYPNTSTAGAISVGTRYDIGTAYDGNIQTSLAIADVDGDGRLDITTGYNEGTDASIQVYHNEYTSGGGFAFTTSKFQSALTISGRTCATFKVVAADFNNDGKVDMGAITHYSSFDTSFVNIFYNASTSGTPNFGTSSGKVVVGFGGSGGGSGIDDFAAAFDLNGDNKPDVISTNYGPGNIATLLNLGVQGSGNLAARVGVSLSLGGSLPSALVVGDLDGDGKIDFGASSDGDNSIVIQRNNSNASSVRVAARSRIPIGTAPIYADLCDMDGDGLPDLVAISSTSLYIKSTLLKSGALTPGRLPF